MRLKAAILGAPLVGLALAAVAAAHGGFAAAEPWRWVLVPLCLAGGLLAERYPVKIGPEQKVNLGALPSLLAVLLLPPGAGPATAAVGVLAGNRLVRRSWWETAFNAGNVLSAASVAALVGNIGTVTSGTQDARAAAAALLYLAMNLLLAVLPAALHSGRPYVALVRQAATASCRDPGSGRLCGQHRGALGRRPGSCSVAAHRAAVDLSHEPRDTGPGEGQRAAGRRAHGPAPFPHGCVSPGGDAARDDHDQPLNPSARKSQRWAGEAIEDSVAEAERMKRTSAPAISRSRG